MKSPSLSLKINLGLLLLGLIMVFSGLLIQIKYHIGNHDGIDIIKSVWGLSHSEWLIIHKISVIIFSFFLVYHINLHWRWFKAVVKKNLIAKNRHVITLSILFLLVALTGFLPWLIKLTGGDESILNTFIEIHDKIALILLVYLALHISSRIRWFITTFDKLKK
ncbi:DUF4405 domain-containing protein [Labilibaculum manganireducens]|uniref:DUF4405 domain-containing protein n=1 Tax=Labilibaculum manganireducens TaxID=1940525 RepID=UPI0029F4CE3C|nr:DUF4405 domain-containing protein [Labilibaculum manganireducens]